MTKQGNEAVLELLPWLVNGTLDGDEMQRARAATGTDLEARRQLRELEALAAVVRDAPLLDASPELGFERLKHQLDRNWAKPTRVLPPPPQQARRIAHRGLALAAGVLLALFANEVAIEPSLAPSFRALTEAPAHANLHVVFDAALDAAAIDARLAAHGATRVGPVGAGNRVEVDPGGADRAALAAALGRDPAVRLVGGAAPQPR
jgi:hypothetical protein